MAENPYDTQELPVPQCLCGRHRSQLEHEHEHEARRVLQCVTIADEERRCEGVLAQAAMRVHFPKC
jgi:hypothetical protein